MTTESFGTMGLLEPVYIPPYFRPRQHFESRFENTVVYKERYDQLYEPAKLPEVNNDQTSTSDHTTQLIPSPIKVSLPRAHVRRTATTLLATLFVVVIAIVRML